MSTNSEQEMSEGSNSPASYTTLESPHSSPLQQVPQLSPTYNGISCPDKNLYKFTKNESIPYLRIVEQPQSYFRFRYDTEKSGSTHGSILGKSYDENKTSKKTHPTVELVNYSGKAEIRCSIKYINDKNMPENIYKILEDEQTTTNFSVPKKKSYTVGFRGIGVHTIKKVVLTQLLFNRISSKDNSVNTSELRVDCDHLAKSIDQNVVRLKFSAHDENGKEICDPVLSDPIFNKKNAATNALKICRMSMYSGRPSGGDDIFLLVDKIDKNEIKVRFFEVDENGKELWTAWGVFLPRDVHYQCAIVCRTPRYRDPKTSVDVKVWIELVRASNYSKKSEPKEFKYVADPVYRQYKRRKIATPCSAKEREATTNFKDASLQIDPWTKNHIDQPVIVLPNDPNEFRKENEVPLAPQSSSESEWNIISSTLDILEDGSVEAPALNDTPGPMWGQSPLSCQPPVISQHATTGMSQAVPLSADPCYSMPQGLSLPAEVGFASQPAQPLSIEVATPSEIVQEDISQLLENALTEYAEVFHMKFEDFFQPHMINDLVGDSGRDKVEPTTSSQTSEAAGDETGAGGGLVAAGASEDANQVVFETGEVVTAMGASVPSYDVTSQDRPEFFPPTGASEDAQVLTAQGLELPDEDLKEKERLLRALKAIEDKILSKSSKIAETKAKNLACEASKNAQGNAVAGTTESADEEANKRRGGGTSESAGLEADADSPAVFTPEDAAEVKKLVAALCATIRDKRSPRSEGVREQLERLFDIRLSNGDTFLHMTLFKNQRSFEALVKMVNSVKMSHLLNYGNNRGETILHLAVIHGTPELVALLVAKGCEPGARTFEEETAVHYAVRYAAADTLRALLDAARRAGAALDLDAANAERQSALHLCALHGRARCAALLGARGASAGARDAAGRTALHLCAYDARAGVLRALLPHAAPHVHARDGGGRTALAVAVARAPAPAALELARALLAAGARARAAWPHAAHRSFRDLLRPHLPDHPDADADAGGDGDGDDGNGDADGDGDSDSDDVKSEPSDDFNSESDDDEYQSADDECFDDATPESLSLKLGQIDLSVDDAKSSTSCTK